MELLVWIGRVIGVVQCTAAWLSLFTLGKAAVVGDRVDYMLLLLAIFWIANIFASLFLLVAIKHRSSSEIQHITVFWVQMWIFFAWRTFLRRELELFPLVLVGIFIIQILCLLILQFKSEEKQQLANTDTTSQSSIADLEAILTSGLIDYPGSATPPPSYEDALAAGYRFHVA